MVLPVVKGVGSPGMYSFIETAKLGRPHLARRPRAHHRPPEWSRMTEVLQQKRNRLANLVASSSQPPAISDELAAGWFFEL
jgi:hypothetical protein